MDFTSEAAWDDALNQLGWRSEERQALAEFAVDKFPTRRAAVVEALGRATRASEDDFASIAKTAAQRTQTPALRAALKRLAATYAARFAQHMCTRAWPDDRPPAVAAAAETPIEDLKRLAFRELGRNAHQLSYGGYFLLSSHLTNSVDAESAGLVFDALATLFEDLVPSDSASDGDYRSLPEAPSNSATSLAGVLWAALGDMASESRWEAAHAVVLLVRLGSVTVLDAIARFAEGHESIAPFVDSRLPFYELHARMWLLLALARSAQEPNSAALSSFTSWLVKIVRGPSHAANQVLAQRTLTELHRRGLTPDAVDVMDAVSARLLPEYVEMTYREQQRRPNPLAREEHDEDEEDKRYRFFFDFEQYWCRDVAEAFGSTEKDVSRSVPNIAPALKGYELFATGKDPRQETGLYAEGRSYPNRGSWPEQDNLAFYIAVHGLLTLTAELAKTTTASKDPESAEDSYPELLAEFLPTRPDGRWLADRRDPSPTPSPCEALQLAEQAGGDAIAGWPWSIAKDDFQKVAGPGNAWITIWSDVRASSDSLSEDTNIECAFVSHETARSLLVTLQTSSLGPCSFSMPTVTDFDRRSGDHPYELIPVVDDAHRRHGIDISDARGGRINFPPLRPSSDIAERFGLTPNDDLRVWTPAGVPVLRSCVWNEMSTPSRDREVGSHGQQLEIDSKFLKVVFAEVDMTLVLQVGLRRQKHRPYYERRKYKDDEFDWLDRSGKIYLIDPNGRWTQY